MTQEGWKTRLKDFLEGNYKLYERDYKIKYRCRYKQNGKWIKAQICFETGEIFANGQVVRRCNIC